MRQAPKGKNIHGLQMKILLDTNIIIPLEDTSRTLDPLLAEMRVLLSQGGHVVYIHPAQFVDIEHDSNEDRKRIVRSRVEQYLKIPSPPVLTESDLSQYGWKQNSENDKIDNLLLHALCRGAAQFLITNDKELHKKARQANVQEQVHRLDQFLAFLNSQIPDEKPPPYGVQERYLHEFNVGQDFFESLRANYASFNQWYLKAAAEGRKAWCIATDDNIQAICIYKVEEKPQIVDGGSPLNGSALKLCTFKVGSTVRGRKLGERLLYSAFRYAARHHLPYVYLHAFGEEQEMLISLCLEYGFQYAGQYEKRDSVYLKTMKGQSAEQPDLDPLEYAVRYYPDYLDGSEVSKYIVPIRPQYHNDLFADISDNSRGLFANDFSQYNSQSNTIKKAYLCHSKTNTLKRGDLLLFYRTQDRKSVECVGIVESTYRGTQFSEVMPRVSKRTVYSEKEIKDWLIKDTLVILFRYLGSFLPVKIDLLEQAAVKGPIQSIRRITHEQYLQCFDRSTL